MLASITWFLSDYWTIRSQSDLTYNLTKKTARFAMGLSHPAHQRFSWWRMHHSLHWCHWWPRRAQAFHQVHWEGLILYKAKKGKSSFMFFPDSAMIFHSQVSSGEVFIIFPSACGVSENESLEISQNPLVYQFIMVTNLSNTFQVDFLASPSFHHFTLHLGGFVCRQIACHLALALVGTLGTFEAIVCWCPTRPWSIHAPPRGPR